MPLTAIDLFCGCGGMTTGLKAAGIEVLAGVDHWDKAMANYRRNHDHLALCEDLTTFGPEQLEARLSGRTVDLVVGGPPCQGFSIAGRRDPKDPRNSLFMEFVKHLRHFRPKAFLMENVMGILSAKTAAGESVLELVLAEFAELYECVVCKLYASDFGVPQNRRRVIFFGVRRDLGVTPTAPEPTVAVRPAVGPVLLPRAEVPACHFLSERALAGIRAKKRRAAANGNGFGAQVLDLAKPSYTIPARYWKDGYDALVRYSDTEVRRLTVLELRRIQTFPDTYVLEGTKKDVIMQIGNAVACRFAEALGLHVRQTLDPILKK
jgi:DNA (cytosine-5)-methyltransferase 1